MSGCLHVNIHIDIRAARKTVDVRWYRRLHVAPPLACIIPLCLSCITHILHIMDHHVLQPLKEPVPTVIILPLRKCNGQRKQLTVTISCHNFQDCSFVFVCEKSAIYANDRSTHFESLNAGTQCQEWPLKHKLAWFLLTRIVLDIIVVVRIHLNYCV
jgi:hypothetical protein